MGKDRGDNPSDHLRAASDAFRGVGAGVVDVLEHLYAGFWIWIDENPGPGFVVLVILEMGVVWVLVRLAGILTTHFYGETVSVGDDLILENFPIPLSLVIWGILILIAAMATYTYLRVTNLRDRIEALESQSDS